MSNSTRCAACKYLRRRCSEDCVLAPYFPPTHPERFSRVHRIFGASNVSGMLMQLPVHERAQAADAISTEACWRVHDPVYGSVGVIFQLQQEIGAVQRELAETRAQIAMHATQLSAQSSQPADDASTSQLNTQQNDNWNMDLAFPGTFQAPEFQ